jgi:hypothetical protein
MEKTQKIEMINGIVKKLSELGYEIVKKDERSGKPETD